jgi:hypothetical protein
MKNPQGFLAVAALFCAAASLPADTITDGSSAGFANGSTNARVGTWNTDTAGNTAPFNGFIGSDTSSNFSASWTFDYSAISDTITSATLELGIYDIDSAAALDEVASYTEGSVDLTSLLNSAANALNGGTGAKNNEYDLLTITLPSTTFADLATGTVDISLALQGPGLGTLGTTSFNGAGIDISTLTINTQTEPSTPEPPTLTLLLASGCLICLIAGFRRLRRA